MPKRIGGAAENANITGLIDAREPQLISYGFYVDEAAANMTVVAVHPDSASLELQMEIGSAEFRKLAHMLEKEAILGDGGTVVSIRRFAGFTHPAPMST